MSDTKTKNLKEEKITEEKLKELQKKSKRPKKILLTLISLGILVFGAKEVWSYVDYSRTHIQTDNAYITGHIVPVNSKVGGHVENIFVEDNQWVKKGDILIEVEKNDLLVKLNQAKANLEITKQELKVAKANYELQKKLSSIEIDQAKTLLVQSKSKRIQVDQKQNENTNEIKSLKEQITSSISDMKAVEAQMNLNKQNYERNKVLYQQGAINKQTVEDSKTKYDVSIFQLDSSKQKIKQLQQSLNSSLSRLDSIEQNKIQSNEDITLSEKNLQKSISNTDNVKTKYEQIKAQEARVKQAEENLNEVKLKLSYTTIKAPVSGLISKKNVELGQTISENQSLMSVIPLNNKKDLWIIANLKETQIGDIHKGEEVEVKVDAYPNLKLKAEVDSIGGGTGSVFSLLPPDNATGNFTKVVQRIPVKIVFSEWSQELASMLRPGLSTTVSIHSGK